MANWRSEYTAALHSRDERERAKYSRVSEDFIDAYTALLSRTAALEAEKAALLTQTQPPSPTPSSSAQTPPPSDPQLRLDLANALRTSASLSSRLKTTTAAYATLQTQASSSAAALSLLTKERTQLLQKVKDRDEEIRGKDRLVQEVHDENIILNTELQVSEQNIKKLKEENRQLIERWMEWKGREAEEMNRAWERGK